jgi:hypothetical protein
MPSPDLALSHDSGNYGQFMPGCQVNSRDSSRGILQSRSGRSWRKTLEQAISGANVSVTLPVRALSNSKQPPLCFALPQIAFYGLDFRILGKNHILPI